MSTQKRKDFSKFFAPYAAWRPNVPFHPLPTGFPPFGQYHALRVYPERQRVCENGWSAF